MDILKKVVGLSTLLLLSPTSAFAANIPDAGEEPGAGLRVLETVFWFIGVPAAIVGVVTFIWALGNWRRTAEDKSVVVWTEQN
jgi:hypothetical protein